MPSSVVSSQILLACADCSTDRTDYDESAFFCGHRGRFCNGAGCLQPGLHEGQRARVEASGPGGLRSALRRTRDAHGRAGARVGYPPGLRLPAHACGGSAGTASAGSGTSVDGTCTDGPCTSSQSGGSGRSTRKSRPGSADLGCFTTGRLGGHRELRRRNHGRRRCCACQSDRAATPDPAAELRSQVNTGLRPPLASLCRCRPVPSNAKAAAR